MKTKFGLMWRIGLALVLALSLCLMTAVPVAALTAATVTPEPTTAGATAQYTIAFETTSDLTTASGDTISIEFPDGTTVPGSYAAGDIAVNTDSVTTASGSAQLVTITVPEDVPVGAVVVLFTTDAGIVNPSIADSYTLDVSTSEEVVVTSGSYNITVAPDSFWVEDEQVGAGDGDPTSSNPVVTNAGEVFNLSIIAIDSDGNTVSDFSGDYRIDFTTTATGSHTIPAFESLTFTGGVAADTTVGFILTNADESPTITATCTALSLSGESAAITVDPVEDHLTITGEPDSVTAGEVFSTDVIVTAYDAYGNVATDDEEVVNWTCDGTATQGNGLPADSSTLVEGTYTFDKADFVLTEVLLAEDGTTAVDTTITATGVDSSLSATATVTVNPAAASEITATADPASIAADGSDSSTITITAQDEFGNTDTNYTGSVTFETNLGTLSSFDSNFVSGVAEATLTSTDVAGGTATVVVSSGTMDTTQTVTLTDAPTEVWVDATGNDSNPGTDALPFKTIGAGITAAGAGGTVNVAAGTYAETVLINTQLTLKGANYGVSAVTGDRGAESVIEGPITISAAEVTVDGFTMEHTGTIMTIPGVDVIVKNNILTAETCVMGITLTGTGATISGNELGINTTMNVEASDCALSYNTFGAGIDLVYDRSDITITGNIIIGSEYNGITLKSGSFTNILIEGNTISETTLGEGTGINVHTSAVDVIDLVIRGNDITDNEKIGILIANSGIWGTANTINNNNISGNTEYGINNTNGDVVDAEDNWWGDDTGPVHSSNPDATGDEVSDDVDYRPWLTSAYAEPVDPVTTATISLDAGYNLVSLPLIPDESAIDTMTASLTELEKIRQYDADWFVYNPDMPFPSGSTLLTMDDGWGYWVKMEDLGTGGSFTFTGSELVADPEELPPFYDVVEGWNLIGFKSTTSSGIATYLGGVSETLDAIYGYQDGAFFIPTELEPGLGYWIAVTGLGTIYP